MALKVQINGSQQHYIGPLSSLQNSDGISIKKHSQFYIIVIITIVIIIIITITEDSLCINKIYQERLFVWNIFIDTKWNISPRGWEPLQMEAESGLSWGRSSESSPGSFHSPRQETGWRQIHSARLGRRTTGPFLGNEEWKYFEEMYSNVFKTLFVHNIEFLPDHTSLPRYLSQVRNTSDQQFI